MTESKMRIGRHEQLFAKREILADRNQSALRRPQFQSTIADRIHQAVHFANPAKLKTTAPPPNSGSKSDRPERWQILPDAGTAQGNRHYLSKITNLAPFAGLIKTGQKRMG